MFAHLAALIHFFLNQANKFAILMAILLIIFFSVFFYLTQLVALTQRQ